MQAPLDFDSNSDSMHPADPTLRRTLLLGLGGCVVVGAMVLWLLNVWLQGLIAELGPHSPGRLELWLRVLSLGAGLLVASATLGLATWVRRLAAMTRRDARWPPREFRTATPVPVKTGAAAEAEARQLDLYVALLFILATLVLAWMVWIVWPLLA